jgi:Cu-processing system permease protein
MDKLYTVAAKEFKDGLRNRWTGAITLIYAVLSLGLAYFGSAASGTLGFASLHSTIISLASLAVVLIPLIALMLSYNAFVGEYEQGTMLLLLTYPLSRAQLLLGKFLGQGAILAVSAVLGFGVAALAIISFSDSDAAEVIRAFGAFIVSAVLLGWVFVALAYVISVLVSEKSKAAGLALLVWFLFVLVFDLGLMALLVASEGHINSELLPLLLLFNPTDIFRLINYMVIDAESYGGVLQLAQQSRLALSQLFAVMLIWVVTPLALAWVMFKRKVM